MFSRSDRKINPPVAGVHVGQTQGGISTPANSPYVFLFTSAAGASYGYYDSFRPDGSFWYTGEGQVGDIELVRGNAAIAEHHANKKRLLLFEYVKKGIVRFLGEVEYLGDHKEERLDRNGNNRKAIIFHLGFLPPARKERIEQPKASYLGPASLPKDLPLDQLRQIALEGVAPNSSLQQKRVNVARRAEAVRRYALARAKGICEGCLLPAPFSAQEGPYLEVHHVFRLSDGGPDHPAAVIALCPNCHRHVHYGTDGDQFNGKLIEWLRVHEGPAS